MRYGHDITTTTVLFVSSAINRMRFGADCAWIIQTQTPFPPISPRHQQATQNHLSWDPTKRAIKKTDSSLSIRCMDGSEIQFYAAKIYESQPPTIRRFSYFLVNSGFVEPSTVKIVRCDKSDLLTWLKNRPTPIQWGPEVFLPGGKPLCVLRGWWFTSWWFQPIWKIFVKMGIFPK